jgi:putative transposase
LPARRRLQHERRRQLQDNAVCRELFRNSQERVRARLRFRNAIRSVRAISNYIENYYDAKRRHSAAGNQSPINFELANSGRLAA